MKIKRTRWGKFRKACTRTAVMFLGGLLFLGIILLPKAVSSAQFLEQLGLSPYLPIVLDNAQFGPTDTITPSPTFTVTGTLPSPTKTGTAGPSPTNTLTPSPTFTGTLTPNATVTVTVSPSSAKVNESFTFTIKVGNTGTAPTNNNVIFDPFNNSFMDVITVTSSRGAVTKQTHSFYVTIGDVLPGEIITITAVVKVNSTLTATQTLSNVVTLTYNETSKTASVTYKVVAAALPPTGDLPLNWREERIKPLGLIPGIVLMVLGITALLSVLWWSKVRESKDRLWVVVGGSLLVVIGFAVGLTTSGLIKPVRLAQNYSMTPTAGGAIAQVPPVEPSATVLAHLPASAFSTPDSVVPIVTLPNYPIPTPVLTITPQPGEPGPDLSAITRIVIPALFLDTEVKYVPYDGVSWMISGLRQEVAWMGNTSWPGLGSNTALAGHVTVAGMGDGPFRHLDELPAGEKVLLYTQENIYTYLVRESKVTDDGDMSVILPSDNPEISLITCVDWDQDSRTYLNRLVVVADLVDTEPLGIGMLP